MNKKIEGAEDLNEYLSRPNNLAELPAEEHLAGFICKYVKDMKNECIELLIHPLVLNYLDSCNVSEDDLSRLEDD